MEQPGTKNQQRIWDIQIPLGVEDGGCPSLGVGSPREKRGRIERGGRGLLKGGMELLVKLHRGLKEGSFK